MRTIIDLTLEQVAQLKEVAERDGISRAEAVRRAIDVAYARVTTDGARQARDAAFGLWKGRRIDSLRYVDRLRDEWEARLQELHGSRYLPPGKATRPGGHGKAGDGSRAVRVSEKSLRKPRKK